MVVADLRTSFSHSTLLHLRAVIALLAAVVLPPLFSFSFSFQCHLATEVNASVQVSAVLTSGQFLFVCLCECLSFHHFDDTNSLFWWW